MLGERLVRASHHALVFLIVVGSVAVLSAQAVMDPRYVEFTPSADHNTLASDGTPLVARYALSIYPQGSSTAFATVDLGKPAPGTGGVITVDFLPLLPTQPTPGIIFEGRVTALGPGGATASALSNTFAYTLPCAPTISPTSRSIAQTATTGSVTVTATTGCAWSAASSASWISISSGSSGSGNGSVSYSVSANTVATSRTGTMTIAGQTFTITQAAAGCTFSLSPATRTAPAAGESNTTDVTAPTGCSWTAASGASWISISGGATGSGNGTVAYSVAPNTAGSQRTGTMTIAGQTFSVTQTAASCTYSLTPASRTAAAAGESNTTSVTAPTGCTWTAASGASWITIGSGATGSGNGTVSYTVAANTSATQRIGMMTIGGQTFTVTQTGAGCTFSLSPTSRDVTAAGGSSTASVSAPAGCAWAAVSNASSWLTVTGGATGNGSGTVTFAAAANSATQSRSGSMTIAGQTLTVNQSAATCSYSISPGTLTVAAAGGPASTTVTAATGCAWSTTSNVSWITADTGGSGDGNGTATVTVAVNSTTSSRSGTATVAGRTLTITQSASTCTYTLTPTSRTLPATAGTGSTVVTTGSQCAWTARASNNWITVSASGPGGATVTYSVTANNSANQRTGTITIGSQVHTIVQSGSPPPNSPRSLRIVTVGGD